MSTVPLPHEEVSPAITVQSAGATGTKIAAVPSFTPVEWEEFWSEDKQATIGVAGVLMTCFTLGLFLYLTVLICCIYTN
jgi:hypothetical protein